MSTSAFGLTWEPHAAFDKESGPKLAGQLGMLAPESQMEKSEEQIPTPHKDSARGIISVGWSLGDKKSHDFHFIFNETSGTCPKWKHFCL